MPSDYPKHLLPRATGSVTSLPYIRTLAFTGAFFTVLALLLIAMRLIPVAPPL